MRFREGGPQQPVPNLDSDDFYERLGVPRDATQTELGASFKSLARRYHPSAEGIGDEEKMKRVTEAYTALKLPESRAKYDRDHPPQAARYGSPFRNSSSFGDSSYFDDTRYPFDRTETNQGETGSKDHVRPKAQKNEEEKTAPPPKEPERLTPEQIKEQVVNRAQFGAQDFKNFVDSLAAAAYPNTDQLVHLPELADVVIKRAVNQAWNNPTSYNIEVGLWAQIAGFDRSKVDASPEVHSVIYRGLLSDILFPTMFGRHVRDWERCNPTIHRMEVLRRPEFIAKLKDAVEKAREDDVFTVKQYGDGPGFRDRRLNDLTAQWNKEVGVDILSLDI